MRALLIILKVFVSSAVFSETCEYPNYIDTRDELEHLYAKSNIVFLADVEFEVQDDPSLFVWNYSLLYPVLKGSVSKTGKLYKTESVCDGNEAINKGIYLVGFSQENENLSYKNTVPIVYGEGKVIENWAIEWLKEKHITKSSTRTQ